jgi:hypothetical protein
MTLAGCKRSAIGSTSDSERYDAFGDLVTAVRDPAGQPAMRSPKLAGQNLAAFKKLMTAQLAERERESRL